MTTSEQTRKPLLHAALGVVVVLALSWVARYLSSEVPKATKGTALAGIGASIEFPIYAILLGLLGNAVLSATGVRERLSGGFRTEFFIKTGLVLLGRRSTCR